MLRSLTALRFPAALLVFFWHAPLTHAAAVPLSTGYVGVGFFFVLSGFILAYNYRPPFSLRAFYAARFARIYPVHLCGVLLALAAVALFGGPHWTGVPGVVRWGAFALQPLLLQSWCPDPDVHFGGNGPAWSLSDEAFFYALFPLGAAAIVAALRNARAATLLAAAAALWALLAAALSGVHAAFDQWNVYIFPPIRFVDFAVGMLAGNAFLRRGERSGRPILDPALLEVAAVCAFALGLALTAYAPQSLRFAAAMMPFSAALIFVFALQGGPLSRLLSAPLFVRLGEASYAFYVVHLSAIFAASALLPRHPAIAFVAALAASLVLSLAVYRYVETPLRGAIRRRLAPRAQVPTHPPLLQGAQTTLPR